VFGLPESQLGLLPALGGTYDLPRLVGLVRGLEMLLGGRRIDARRALASGLVDEVTPPSLLLRAAFARLRPRADSAGRGDVLARSIWGRGFILRTARRHAERKARGRFPAIPALLEAVEAGLREGRPAAQRAEAERFGALAASPVAKNLIALFLESRRQAGAHGTSTPRGESAPIGILGAGFMGAGIAAEAVRRDFRVRLHDLRPDALGAALAACAKSVRVGRAGAPRFLGNASATFELWGFSRAGIVIEAIVEDEEAKRALLAAVEPQLSPSAILASNTSTIPISRLAAGLRHPNRFLGLHFFSPVAKMPLVEVVRHPGTADVFLERARGFVAALGKTPIVVRDGPGFYTTRILTPYLAQAVELLREGWSIVEIDAAAREAGFPVGPLELLDEVGIDVAAGAARTMAEAFPERMPLPREWKRLLESGRFGRKRGQGFYDYKNKSKRPDPEIRELLEIDARARGRARRENGERLLWAMVVEAVRCLEDGTLERPADGDVGAVLGLGFPPDLGGPFRWLDAAGPAAAAERLAKLAAAHGPVFAVPPLLEDLARRGVSFRQPDGPRLPE
jgi:3-hydroxyacyl-CoA dehydrogenase/enoyl-CoA hydratase/3-hydroxybutyryl-CoA epimerase